MKKLRRDATTMERRASEARESHLLAGEAYEEAAAILRDAAERVMKPELLGVA